tara:strand:- start:104 stop:250 length:147 start_codon:yes stop_codon:yes gene_type:complete
MEPGSVYLVWYVFEEAIDLLYGRIVVVLFPNVVSFQLVVKSTQSYGNR